MTTEAEQRARVRDEARRWLGTPYHHQASVINVGVDCAQLLSQAFAGAHLIDPVSDVPRYTCDWHLHQGEERYLGVIERYAHRVDEDERSIADRGPDWTTDIGNILMWRVGRTFSHSAIVTDWPKIIHSYLPSRIVEEIDIRGTPMSRRPMRVYSYWGPNS